MSIKSFAVATVLVLCGAVGVSAQSLTHYVKYETAGRIGWGLLEGDTIRELQGNVFDGAKPNGRTLKLSDVKLLPPADAKKVVAAGLNYRSHIGEQSPAKYVGLFAKLPTSLVGHNANIVYPADATTLHYESEVCLVIGKRAKNISEAQVKDHVFGVAPCNDVSERAWQKADLQWFRAKGSDTFGPIGPALVRGADYNKLTLIGRHKRQGRAGIDHRHADLPDRHHRQLREPVRHARARRRESSRAHPARPRHEAGDRPSGTKGWGAADTGSPEQ